MNRILRILSLTSTLAAVPARAADPVLEAPPPSLSGWEFRAEPYGWLLGVDGTLGVRGFNAGVDAGFFNEVADHLDMAAALQLEARHGRWGIIADGFYAKLGASGETPGPLYESVAVDYRQFLGELAVAYRLHEDPCFFVDLYAGVRYTNLSLDIEARESPPDIAAFSTRASDRIVESAVEKADAIAAPRLDEYKTALAAERAEIEQDVRTAAEAAADRRADRILKRELRRIHRGKPLHLKLRALVRSIGKQRLEMAEAAASLKVAEMRASVDAALQSEVDQARLRLSRMEKDLAKSIRQGISDHLTTTESGDEEWFDPFIGLRSQWNFHEKWFLAAKGDIGGFGIGADLAWSLQATVGYQFTHHVSAELGYRHLFTDYSDGGFTWDLAQAGLYTGVNIRF